jgi:hypothetical protein
MFRGAEAEFSMSMVIVREAWALSRDGQNKGFRAKYRKNSRHCALCLLIEFRAGGAGS